MSVDHPHRHCHCHHHHHQHKLIIDLFVGSISDRCLGGIHPTHSNTNNYDRDCEDMTIENYVIQFEKEEQKKRRMKMKIMIEGEKRGMIQQSTTTTKPTTVKNEHTIIIITVFMISSY